MLRRLALLIAVSAAPVAVPATASAAVSYRCAASAVSGSVLGTPLPTPSAGSTTEACKDDSTLPTLALPGPLAPLVNINAVNAVTTATDAGVFAAGGLGSVKLGTIPVPLPPLPQIPIPPELTNITLQIPGALNLISVKVDLTPAVTAALNALNSRDSNSLLDVGLVYASAYGACSNGAPTVGGGSRVADGTVLGQPLNLSRATDQALTLVDTSSLDPSKLDLNLATINASTPLGAVTLSSAQLATVLAQVQAQLASLPKVSIPAQVAQVKVTPPSQQLSGGSILQLGPRVQISLAGTSLADLTIGAALISASGDCATAPGELPADAPASEVALACTTRKLALIDVLRRGDHVRLYGAADKSLAGKVVKITFQATGRVVAATRIASDGAFSTTAPLPRRSIRNTNRARYVARVGRERSLNLKLTRRMIVRSIASHGGFVTIRGQVIRPLAKPVAPIVLKRRVTCKTLETVKTFKPRRNGRFTVTVRKPENLAATIYRLQTRVRRTTRSTKTSPTFTLPRAVDL